MEAASELFHKQLDFLSVCLLLLKSAVWAQNSSPSHHPPGYVVEQPESTQPGLLWGEIKWKPALPKCSTTSGEAVDVQLVKHA